MNFQLPIFIRKTMKLCLSSACIIIIIVISIFVYSQSKVKWAKKQIDTFSNSVHIGMPVVGLQQKAAELNLNYLLLSNSNEHEGTLIVWEGFVFDRWFCDVEYKDGKVTNNKVTFLD